MSSAAWAEYRVPGSPYFVLVDGPAGRVRGEGTGATWEQVSTMLRQANDDASDDGREVRIDRELLAHGIVPGDPSLFRTAEQIARGRARMNVAVFVVGCVLAALAAVRSAWSP